MLDAASTVYISVGSNIEPEKNLQAAVDLLAEICEIQAVSSVYQSPAFGFENQPDFLDIAVKLITSDAPDVFKSRLDGIEKQLGRDRASQANKYGPLTLDIDILLWNETAFDYGTKPWHVPDKSILKFGAVAIPLAEIAPSYIHPEENETLTDIANRFDADEISVTGLSIRW